MCMCCGNGRVEPGIRGYCRKALESKLFVEYTCRDAGFWCAQEEAGRIDLKGRIWLEDAVVRLQMRFEFEKTRKLIGAIMRANNL